MKLSRQPHLVVFGVGILLLSLGGLSAFAQSATSGTLQGKVTDQQNAAIPDVQVKLLTALPTQHSPLSRTATDVTFSSTSNLAATI